MVVAAAAAAAVWRSLWNIPWESCNRLWHYGMSNSYGACAMIQYRRRYRYVRVCVRGKKEKERRQGCEGSISISISISISNGNGNGIVWHEQWTLIALHTKIQVGGSCTQCCTTYVWLHANFVLGGGGGGGDGPLAHAYFDITKISYTKVRVSPFTVKRGMSADGSHMTERIVCRPS